MGLTEQSDQLTWFAQDCPILALRGCIQGKSSDWDCHPTTKGFPTVKGTRHIWQGVFTKVPRPGPHLVLALVNSVSPCIQFCLLHQLLNKYLLNTCFIQVQVHLTLHPLPNRIWFTRDTRCHLLLLLFPPRNSGHHELKRRKRHENSV